jgi:hypothetical protein
MLTKRQQQILSGAKEITGKSGKKITVTDNYRNTVRYKAKTKCLRDMESLIFIAEHFPEAIEKTQLVTLVKTLISHGKPERRVSARPRMYVKDRETGKEYWKRIPKTHKRDLQTGTLKVGTWEWLASRKKDGAPNVQPEVYSSMELVYNLSELMHNHLTTLSPLIKALRINDVVELEKTTGFNLRCWTFDTWLKQNKGQHRNKPKILVII